MRYVIIAAVALSLSACGGTENTTSTTVENDMGMAAGTSDLMMADTGMNDMAMTPGATPGTVTVTISGVTANQGPVLVALQSEGQFAALEGAYTDSVDSTGATVTATFENVPAGRYAAAAFQDSNSDGTTEIGATGPTEPWGFSGGSQPGAPAFMPATFEVTEAGGSASVALSGGE